MGRTVRVVGSVAAVMSNCNGLVVVGMSSYNELGVVERVEVVMSRHNGLMLAVVVRAEEGTCKCTE